MNLQVGTKELNSDFFAVPAGGNGSTDAATLERLASSVFSKSQQGNVYPLLKQITCREASFSNAAS